MTVDVQTLVAVCGALVVPSLGGLVWLVRALGNLGSGIDTINATVSGFGVKLDDLSAEQDKARQSRGEIKASMADHDKRLTLSERDVDRWLSGVYTPPAAP
jgi:3-hydroxyacyl-CoA dehydrogenase